MIFFDIFWLIFAHYIGDVAFMNKWLFDLKSRSFFIALAHSIIWSGCIAIALNYMGKLTVWKIAFLVIGHLLIDLAKDLFRNTRWAKPLDEVLHYLQLLVVYIF